MLHLIVPPIIIVLIVAALLYYIARRSKDIEVRLEKITKGQVDSQQKDKGFRQKITATVHKARQSFSASKNTPDQTGGYAVSGEGGKAKSIMERTGESAKNLWKDKMPKHLPKMPTNFFETKKNPGEANVPDNQESQDHSVAHTTEKVTSQVRASLEGVTQFVRRSYREKATMMADALPKMTRRQNKVKKASQEQVVAIEVQTPKKGKMEDLLIERIATNPKDIEAYERLGEYYMEQEVYMDAKECYKQVLRLSPVHRYAKIQMKKLEKILS
ncbi:MAG: hypothetical protein KC736_02650 [Candidatus Moranbacteria bacterium]|nr:hypothetical protein [Candidatus Moranbacteria bacterium]